MKKLILVLALLLLALPLAYASISTVWLQSDVTSDTSATDSGSGIGGLHCRANNISKTHITGIVNNISINMTANAGEALRANWSICVKATGNNMDCVAGTQKNFTRAGAFTWTIPAGSTTNTSTDFVNYPINNSNDYLIRWCFDDLSEDGQVVFGEGNSGANKNSVQMTSGVGHELVAWAVPPNHQSIWNVWNIIGDNITTPDTIPPSITNYSSQGSSCTNWNTNTSKPCTTSDTTPTLYFNTSEAAYCAIATSSWNYTQMGSSRNCASGENTIEHACDLIPGDELVYEDSTAYLSCKDSSGNMNKSGESTSGPLKLSITGLEAAGRTSIGTGIQNALLSGYTNYTDLQIYARNLSNAQAKGTFDRAVKKGSKMWAFNRIGVSDSHVNMINLTPVLYTLELANRTSSNITLEVEKLINATK